jgi:hypothetical protein
MRLAQPLGMPAVRDWHAGRETPPCLHAPLQAEEQAGVEAQREEEQRKLARERRVIEQQSRAILKLASKKERSAVQVG